MDFQVGVDRLGAEGQELKMILQLPSSLKSSPSLMADGKILEEQGVG
jgi:hypothetical protein